MKWCKKFLSIIILCTVLFCVNISPVYASGDDISYGADIGWLSQLEEQGIKYVDDCL